jgi:methylated-DNA-[protein]-cysteine S-methyltransferase
MMKIQQDMYHLLSISCMLYSFYAANMLRRLLMAIYLYNSPIGRLLMEEKDGYITQLSKNYPDITSKEVQQMTPIIKDAITQLEEYFAGQRKEFTIPIKPEGTDYMKSIWKQLVNIPYGTTLSYGQVAEMAGNKKGARSAGMACGRNPILILIPCHRVIGADGSLTGFACGLDTKKALLKLEKEKTELPH